MLAGAPLASAQTFPWDDPAAPDQYVEDIPTSEGSQPVGGSPAQGGQGTAPSEGVGGAEASGEEGAPSGEEGAPSGEEGAQETADELLEQIATSSAYGAPQRSAAMERSRRGGAGTPSATLDPNGDVSAGDTLSAASSAVTDDDDGALRFLLVALVGIAAVAGVAAGVRNKRRSR